MTTETIKDLNGDLLRLIARVKTTKHENNSIKPIDTDSTTIEVLIFDGVMISTGSQFGHVAVDIDGVIYSQAHSWYVAIVDGKGYKDSNQKYRDFEGLVLRLSTTEKEAMKKEFERRIRANAAYNILDNSCSTNVAEVLESVGILAHDPRFKLDPSSTELVTPKEVLIIVSRSKRMVKRNHYPNLKK